MPRAVAKLVETFVEHSAVVLLVVIQISPHRPNDTCGGGILIRPQSPATISQPQNMTGMEFVCALRCINYTESGGLILRLTSAGTSLDVRRWSKWSPWTMLVTTFRQLKQNNVNELWWRRRDKLSGANSLALGQRFAKWGT